VHPDRHLRERPARGERGRQVGPPARVLGAGPAQVAVEVAGGDQLADGELSAVTAAVADPAAVVQVPSRSEALALLYMAVLTTAAAFLLWYDGVVRLGADRAGLFAGVMPVAGYVAGVALGTSVASATALVGAVLCGVGVAVGMTAGTRRRSAAQARFSDQSPAHAGQG